MLIQITDAGVALMENATQPLVMTSYQLGSAFGYTPQANQTALSGSLVYTGVPSLPVNSDLNTLLYPLYVAPSAGPFQFGEIGLFYGSQLFAICVLEAPLTKAPLNLGTNTGGPILIDFFVPIVSTNYQMWANATQANTVKASTVTGPEGLPPSPNALPNMFVVEPAGVGQTFLAFSDRFGVWSFVGFASVADNVGVVSATANTITVPTTQLNNLTFQGLGTLLLQVTSGAAYSASRYVDAVTVNGANSVLSLNAPLLTIPAAGDKITAYEPQSAQTPSGSIPPGVFTTLSSSGTTTLGPTQATSINNTPIGASTPSTGRFTTLTATGNTTLGAVTATSINNTPIGATTPATGRFTNLEVTTALTGAGLTTLFQSPGPIGAGTASTGRFTTLTATGATSLQAVTATTLNGAVIGGTTPAAATFTNLTVSGPASFAGITNTGNAVLAAVTATTIQATGAVSVGSLTVAGSASFTSLNSTPIGQTTAAAGSFTTLTATGTTTLQAVTTGPLVAQSLNSTPIGATTHSTGRFTTLTATGATSLQAVTAVSLQATSMDSTPIGATTPATGRFTTLAATGLVTANQGLNLAGAGSPIQLNGSPGTTGQVLVSQGAGATPIWGSAVVGGGSPSFASVTVTGAVNAGSLVAGGMDSTPVGATTPSTGRFTTLTATGNTTLVALNLTGALSLSGVQGTAGQVLVSGGAAVPTWGTAVMSGSSPTFPAVTVSGTAALATVTATSVTTPTAAIGALTLSDNTKPLIATGLAGTNGQVLSSRGPGASPQWINLTVTSATLTSGSINNVPIGATTPSTGAFTSLSLPGLTAPFLVTGSAGTLGQVLTSQGPGATPLWVTPSGGGGGGGGGGAGSYTVTGGSINNTVIGNSTPSSGIFSSLGVNGAATLQSVTVVTVDASSGVTLSGATSPMVLGSSAGVAGQVLTSQGAGATPIWTTPSGGGGGGSVTITGGTIDGTEIGTTTPDSGAFTTLASSGATTLGAVTATSINSTPIGAGTAAAGAFTTLASSGATTLGAVTATSINSTPIGATTHSTGRFTTLTATGTTSLQAVTATTLNGAVIGGTTPAAATFTTLNATGAATLAALTATSLDSTPIGATTHSTGRFTTLTATGATTLAAVSTTGLTLTGTTSPVTLNASVGTVGQVLTSQGAGATPTWTTPSGGGGGTTVSINNQTGTTYTFVLGDAGLIVRQSNAAAITTTIPTNASVAFPVGTVLTVRQVGAGQVTLAPAGGVTLNIPTGYLATTGRQGANVLLHKVATDEWDLTGDLGV